DEHRENDPGCEACKKRTFSALAAAAANLLGGLQKTPAPRTGPKPISFQQVQEVPPKSGIKLKAVMPQPASTRPDPPARKLMVADSLDWFLKKIYTKRAQLRLLPKDDLYAKLRRYQTGLLDFKPSPNDLFKSKLTDMIGWLGTFNANRN